MGKPLFKSAKQIAVDAQALKLAMQRGDNVSSDKSTVRYEDDDSAYINTVLPDVVVTPKYKDYDDYNKTIAARDRSALEQQQREMNNYVRSGMNKAGEIVAGAMMMMPPVAAADPIAAGVGRMLRFAMPRLRTAARASQVAANNATSDVQKMRSMASSRAANTGTTQAVVGVDDIHKWTPEQWTAAQDVAIARGDMAEAQRLRDLHFKSVSPNNAAVNESGMPQRLYHNTEKEFNSFDISRTAHGKKEGNGVYSGVNPQPKYGKNQIDLYTYISNPYTETKEWSIASSFGGTTQSQYWNTGKKIENYMRDAVPIRSYSEYRRYLSSPNEFSSNPLKRLINPSEKIKSLFRVGDYSQNSYKKYVDSVIEANNRVAEYNDRLRNVYNSDGVIVNWINHPANPREFIALPNRYKSADAVTYDDNGVRIPLGGRDDFNMNDIRYALPFVLPSSKLSVEDEVYNMQLNN